MKIVPTQAVKLYDNVRNTREFRGCVVVRRKRKGGYDVLLFTPNEHENHDVTTLFSSRSEGPSIAFWSKYCHGPFEDVS